MTRLKDSYDLKNLKRQRADSRRLARFHMRERFTHHEKKTEQRTLS